MSPSGLARFIPFNSPFGNRSLPLLYKYIDYKTKILRNSFPFLHVQLSDSKST